MEFGLTKENVKKIAWHALTAGIAAALLAALDMLGKLELDPNTAALVALAVPTVKAVIELFRKG